MAGPPAAAALSARFPAFGKATGGYESFYVRAVDPAAPRAVWLRHTVHQTPGDAPLGSIWVTLFDAAAPAPSTHKVTVPGPEAADWIRIGESAFGPGGARGSAGPAAWDLRWSGEEPALRHLPAEWMYRAPLPRTKLESPLPAIAASGTVRVGDAELRLDGWPGMVGHNWGTQHAERWIWLHGTAFEGREGDWLDLSLGRVRVGGLTTPWVANGVVSLGGERLRVGGIGARPHVAEGPLHLELRVPGGPVRLRLTVHSVPAQTVVWRYADPDGAEHHVANCSIAAMEAVVHHGGRPAQTLRTAHGAAYELGMREVPDRLDIQPFSDP